MKRIILFFAFSFAVYGIAFSQDIKNNANSNHANKFEQLGTILPTPNEYRTAESEIKRKITHSWNLPAENTIYKILTTILNRASK